MQTETKKNVCNGIDRARVEIYLEPVTVTLKSVEKLIRDRNTRVHNPFFFFDDHFTELSTILTLVI
jgi:hypothetical protein